MSSFEELLKLRFATMRKQTETKSTSAEEMETRTTELDLSFEKLLKNRQNLPMK